VDRRWPGGLFVQRTARPDLLRNDVRQYDDLADQWWADRGAFAMLHWIAAARAALLPRADRPGALLVDVACGGGLMASHVARRGYRHVGLDLSPSAVAVARRQGVHVVRADASALPLPDGCADVVVAGEVLEHVTDLAGVVGEVCRVLRPAGLLVIDTIADTWWARFTSITVAERLPAGPPQLLHDGTLFVNRAELVRLCASHGVDLVLRGLRPSVRDYLAWLVRRRDDVRMLPTRSTSGLFQGKGTKRASPGRRDGPPGAADRGLRQTDVPEGANAS
jgi:2-polyprenyl-6-hydroxyphenyl methylase/3-demethylubiquinone-9 3-methyltransferase